MLNPLVQNPIVRTQMAITVSLPDLPVETEFEEYVAACLQSCGFYLERSLIDRHEEELLELDVICTSYSSCTPPSEKLIEVKSGGWGFSEVFKMLGWGRYLGFSDLSLVVCKEKPNHDFYKEKTKEIGVSLMYHPNDIRDIEQSDLFAGSLIDPIDVTTWRFSYWAERKMLRKLKDLKKAHPASKSYRVIDSYYHTVNSAIFFSKNVVQRSKSLYEEFKSHPNLSAKVGNESIGGDFDEDHSEIPASVFYATFYASEFTDVTITTYVEHRARLALLKAAVDFCLFEHHGIEERTRHEIEFLGLKFSVKDTLPASFLSGLETIRTDKYFHLYPTFWQTFLWLFGGFLLDDYLDADYRLLSMKTGVPIDQIDHAFSAYEKLFKTPGGWFKSGDRNSRITFLKMMPSPLMGVGAHYRRLYYGNNQDFKELSLTGTYTENDLAKKINPLVDLLK